MSWRDLVLEIVSGEREGKVAHDGGDGGGQNEETELLNELETNVTHLFRVSRFVS